MAQRPDAATTPSADQRALRGLAEENATLARELGRVQARCTQWRDDCIRQADRLEARLVRLRGELIVKVTALAAAQDTIGALQQRAADWRKQDALVRRIGDLRSRNDALERELGEAGLRDVVAHPPTSPALALEGLAVLCVGGRARQVPVYRALIEQAGGRFAHVDGAAPDCLCELATRLADADLVILQPGYVCAGVCRAVETHCARRGQRCVQLHKACVLGFTECLRRALAAPAPELSRP